MSYRLGRGKHTCTKVIGVGEVAMHENADGSYRTVIGDGKTPLNELPTFSGESRVGLRDTFAAAALTGLLAAPTDKDRSSEYWARFSYEIADAMLRERCKTPAADHENDEKRAVWHTNHDAAPAARAAISDSHERPPNMRCQQAGESRCAASGSGSGTGKQPAPPCVETDGFSPGSRTGQINQTPERESPRRECEESSLRDVPQDDKSRAAGGPEHHISEAEIDALEFVVEEGRIANIGDYGILRQLLIRLRQEWEFRDSPEPVKDAVPDRSEPIRIDLSQPCMVDPPSGWQWGFPKRYDPAEDGPMKEWLVRNGYPKHLADKGLPCTFTLCGNWEADK